MTDPVSHPGHYDASRFGVECIEFTRHMPFSPGNAFKYIWRHRDKDRRIEDLRKARWYLDDCLRYEPTPWLTASGRMLLGRLSADHLEPNALGIYHALSAIVRGDYMDAKQHVNAELFKLEALRRD